MIPEGSLLYFDPFVFKNGAPPKAKYFIALANIDESVVLASLPTSKDHIPADIAVVRGTVNMPERAINAYVFEADLLLSNPKIITKYHYTSDFLAIPKDRTDDWCFVVKDGVIREEKVGGENCWQMVGISYWNQEAGEKLSEDLPKVYEGPGGKERYWEQVPLVYCKDNYKVEVRECKEEDIVEIDTFRELKKIDPSYDV